MRPPKTIITKKNEGSNSNDSWDDSSIGASSSDSMNESGTTSTSNGNHDVRKLNPIPEPPPRPAAVTAVPSVYDKVKIEWTADEDHALMVAILEARRISTLIRENEDMEDSSFSDNEKEDWDYLDWDDISDTILERSAVECLLRYLKLSRK